MLPQPSPILQAKPHLRSDLRFSLARNSGQLWHIIEDPINGKLYEVGLREAEMLLNFDGSQTLAQILDQPTKPESLAKHALGEAVNWDQTEVEGLFAWAVARGLLLDYSPESLDRQRKQLQKTNFSSWMKYANPISLQFSLGCPDRWLKLVSQPLSILFSRGALVIWCCAWIYGLACLTGRWNDFVQQSSYVFADAGWVQLLVVWLLIKTLHELGHGVASHRYGSSVKDCGIIMILFMPLAYVDVSSSAKLPDRWQRIIISAAGMYVELFITALAIGVWAHVESPSIAKWCFAVIFTSGISTLLFNANPLMKFDGYYILSDIVNISNLAGRGRQWLGSSFKYWCLGLVNNESSLTGWRQVVVACYGIAAYVWRIMLQFTLTIAAAALFHGLGIVIAVMSVLFFVIAPARGIVGLWKNKGWQRWRWQNLAASLALVMLAIGLVTGILTGPSRIAAPGVVRFAEEKVLRSDAEGFLLPFQVRAGQWVEAGQVIAVLENREVEASIESMQNLLAQAEIRGRDFREKGLWTEFSANQSSIASLKQQLDDRLQERAALELRAPCEGTIMFWDLDQQVGRFFHKGDSLAVINDGKKEVVVSIAQEDFPSLRQQQNAQVHLIFPGTSKISATLNHVSPLASSALPAASLAISHGGSLAVRPVSAKAKADRHFFAGRLAEAAQRPDLMLDQPRFWATIELSGEAASQLPLGQRGTVYFKAKRQSLAAYSYLKFQRWLQGHLRRAGLITS